MVCVLAIVTAAPGVASAAEIRVWTARALATVLAEIGEEFERATGHRLIISSDLPPAFQRRFDDGEPFDVLISGSIPVDEWIRDGRIVAHTRRVTLAAASRDAPAQHAGPTHPTCPTDTNSPDWGIGTRSHYTGPPRPYSSVGRATDF